MKKESRRLGPDSLFDAATLATPLPITETLAYTASFTMFVMATPAMVVVLLMVVGSG